MISRALNSNNDIIVEAGSLKIVTDGDETVQHVRSRLLFYLEEWFLNTTAGVPYFQSIFEKPANLANTESLLKQTILNTNGVESLSEFSMDYESTPNRKLFVAFTAQTTYGEISQEVTLNV